MSGPAPSDLRQLLVQRTAAAVDAARARDGEVSPTELESLERLSRLLDLRDKVAPKVPQRPWTVAIVLVLTLLLLSVLLFVRPHRTAIELEVDTTQVSFTVPTEQLLFERMDLTSLEASGLSRILLPPTLTAKLDGAISAPAPPITLTATEINGRRGSIGIAQIRPTGASGVRLALLDLGGQYRLSLRNAVNAIEVGVFGPVNVAVGGVGETLVDFVAPKGIVLEPGETVNLDFAFRDPSRAEATPQVPVLTPSFRQVDQYGDRQLSIVRTLSTVLGGNLYFESLGGATRQLRSGEALRFGEATGEMRTMRLRPDRLSLNFHGQVSDMTSGDGAERRSLMPTWLELLRAQHGLGLLWGSTLYLAGVAMGVLRWWKGSL